MGEEEEEKAQCKPLVGGFQRTVKIVVMYDDHGKAERRLKRILKYWRPRQGRV
jgi:hypothetical protein